MEVYFFVHYCSRMGWLSKCNILSIRTRSWVLLEAPSPLRWCSLLKNCTVSFSWSSICFCSHAFSCHITRILTQFFLQNDSGFPSRGRGFLLFFLAGCVRMCSRIEIFSFIPKLGHIESRKRDVAQKWDRFPLEITRTFANTQLSPMVSVTPILCCIQCLSANFRAKSWKTSFWGSKSQSLLKNKCLNYRRDLSYRRKTESRKAAREKMNQTKVYEKSSPKKIKIC